MTILALIGPRASGKSTIGRIISKKLGWKFVDFDEYMINYFKHRGFELGFDPQREGGYIYHLKKTKNIDDDQAWKEYYKVNNRELIKFIDKNGKSTHKRWGERKHPTKHKIKRLICCTKQTRIIVRNTRLVQKQYTNPL